MDGNVASLKDIQPGVSLSGVVPDQVVMVNAVVPVDDSAVDMTYTTADGRTDREIIDADSVRDLSVVQKDGSGPRFDADPEEFRLAAEALRITYAADYDPMTAVYSSNINPLPHQIRAVYEDMLPKVPLRFLLADDPGAGKTIMAGLYVKEMLLRSAAERVIIVCPGGLAEQWRDEMSDKFGLDFDVFQPGMQELSRSGNAFQDYDRLIVRMDQVARSDDYRTLLEQTSWDIAVVDEAHRMSAHFRNQYGDLQKTKRFRLGEILAETSENLLLMTATPHSGKEEEFQLFMSLLDKDRFAGRYEAKRHSKTDTAGLMRRMVKEEMLTFDGKPLFPERHAETVTYELSPGEAELYQDVTDYVRSGMSAAQDIRKTDERRGNSIGFALTMLQRRLASSPEAIYQSLRRRRDRLSELLDDIEAHPERLGDALDSRQAWAPDLSLEDFDDLWDEADENAQGRLELEIDEVMASATAARTVNDLRDEIGVLDGLIEQAREVRAAQRDAKWSQLSTILHEHVLDAGTSEQPHKMIIFTEHKDTLNYLHGRVVQLLGRPECVEVIHGGLSRDERKAVQERFVNDPQVQLLVATDAAGEGLNLQRADLMVNYDLPWNPNRIEQRFGRIHRIGQQRVCSLWNMVAKNTREGEVYGKLLDKIEVMDKAYQGRLFNVLGDGKAFDGRSLRDLMLEAIRYGDRPDVQARLDQVIDSSVSQGLDELVSDRSAHPERYASLDVQEIRELMERSRARKLQPGYIAAFFVPALKYLGGTVRRRETGRWEIKHVPQPVRRRIDGIKRHTKAADAYERVTCDPNRIHIDMQHVDATLVAPGTPLLDAVCELIIEQCGAALDRGTVFVDRTDRQPDGPVLLMAVEQTIKNSRNDEVVSRHFGYLQCNERGGFDVSQAPPYLNYDKPKESERAAIDGILHQPWLLKDYSLSAQQYVYTHDTKPRLDEVKARIAQENKHVLDQVETRLKAEIEYWYKQVNLCSENERHGRPRGKNMNSDIARSRAEDMSRRLEQRQTELATEVRLQAKPAVIRGMSLVVPERLVDSVQDPRSVATSTDGRQEVDRRAVALAMKAERSLGRTPVEMPHNNPGFDIQSTDEHGRVFFIEVKGRIARADVDTFIVTANEIAFAQSQGDRHRLALVRVSPDGPEHDEIRYVLHAFDHLSQSESTYAYTEKIAEYWKRGETPR